MQPIETQWIPTAITVVIVSLIAGAAFGLDEHNYVVEVQADRGQTYH